MKTLWINVARFVIVLVAVALFALGCEPEDSTCAAPCTGDACLTDGDVDWDAETEADAEASDSALTVMTFNVLCSFCDATYDPWEERLGYFKDLFNRYQPDVIGLQEYFTKKEVEETLAMNPAYQAIYYQEPGGVFDTYPDAMIFYLSDRLELLDSGFYWLGETPDVPWSGGWADNNFWRLVAWGQFKIKDDGREFFFQTTHFDNNTPNQDMSAPLFVTRCAEQSKQAPVIAVGDFNSKPDSTAYATLVKPLDEGGFQLQNTFDLAETWDVESNQEEPPEYDSTKRIDHIFVGNTVNWQVEWWKVDRVVYGENQLYSSDHFAMTAKVTFE